MSIISNFDVESNFWECYPELKIAGSFRQLYSKDRTVNKQFSSKLMWTIALIWDRKSKYYNITEEGPDGKIILIFGDNFGDKNYYKNNTTSVKELKDFYLSLQISEAERTLRGIEEKLVERDKFLKNTPYSLGEKGDRGYIFGTVDTLDKMMANTPKIYEQYGAARKLVLQEEEADSTRGGVVESLSDAGDI